MISGITRRERSNPSFRLEASFYIHQVQVLEQANREVKKAEHRFAYEQTGRAGFTSPLRHFNRTTATPARNHPEQGGPEEDLHEETPGMTSTRTTSGRIDSDLPEDDVTSIIDLVGGGLQTVDKRANKRESWLGSTTRSQNTIPRREEQRLRDFGESSPSSSFALGTHPAAIKGSGPPDLKKISRQELQNEVMRLQEAVQVCRRSLQSVQKNADLKVQQLELKVLFLECKLADQQVVKNSLFVSNQSLKQELQAVFMKARKMDDNQKTKKMITLHQKEVTMEKHINALLVARNDAMHQNTLLKRMLLQTCHDCRNRLPIKQVRKSLKMPGTETPGKRSILQFKLDSVASIGSTTRSRRVASTANESPMSSSSPSYFLAEMKELKTEEGCSTSCLPTAPVRATGPCASDTAVNDHTSAARKDMSTLTLRLPHTTHTPSTRNKEGEMTTSPTMRTTSVTENAPLLERLSSGSSAKPRRLRLLATMGSSSMSNHKILTDRLVELPGNGCTENPFQFTTQGYGERVLL